MYQGVSRDGGAEDLISTPAVYVYDHTFCPPPVHRYAAATVYGDGKPYMDVR